MNVQGATYSDLFLSELPGEVQNEAPKRKYSYSYSWMRNELYIYNQEGRQVFTLYEDELPDNINRLSEVEVYDWLEDTDSFLLTELGLL